VNSYRDLKEIKVLLAEDESSLANLLTNAIGDYFAKFMVVSNGEEAIESYKENTPDIVITDIMMPKKNGLEMAEELKIINPELPIIILSAHSETNKLLNAIDIGVDKYFIKPFDPDELIDYICTSIVPKIKKSRVIELESGFLFNIKTKKIYKDSKMVQLTRRELQFIELLINSEDYIADDNDIKIALWGELVMDERLRTFIKRLRIKTSKELIKNISGHGYSISVL